MDITSHKVHNPLDIRMSGKFTFSDHPHFRPVIEKISENDLRQIIFYMDKVEFVDSAALGMLLLTHDEAEKHNKKITISGATGQVKKMFNAARLGTLFNMQ